MLNDLKGKVVLITGSSTGIGAAAAVAFGNLGARVAVHYNSSQDAADEVFQAVKATGAQAVLLQGDVVDSIQCKKLVAEAVKAFGRIDILINNAGALVQRVPIEDITDELFDKVVYLNVRSAMMVYYQCDIGCCKKWWWCRCLAVRWIQGLYLHYDTWLGKRIGKRQDSCQCGGAWRHINTVS
jgi:NAD(P)-dependent dehydrogenase (short-subunit alcohol dehydrogenase family)